jgi:hypothetical protein
MPTTTWMIALPSLIHEQKCEVSYSYYPRDAGCGESEHVEIDSILLNGMDIEDNLSETYVDALCEEILWAVNQEAWERKYDNYMEERDERH